MEINFSNPQQRDFYYNTSRNQCFSGGFNNGKTFVGCLKHFTLLSTFSGYRTVFAREKRTDLLKTTYQTFLKICPPSFISSQNLQEGVITFKNGSVLYLLHLDTVDEQTLRGLEINSYLIDQAEEISEQVYDIINARLGRWEKVEIPKELLTDDWPKSEFTGTLIVPSYGTILCNPDTQFHWIYRKYHPNSLERRKDYYYVEGEWDPKLGSKETYEDNLSKDEEWIAKYVKGQWGISNAQIHRLWGESQIDYSDELIDRIKKKGNLFRVLDHGESSPTCCLWIAALDGIYVVYREYYVPNQVVSYHRQAIHDLSQGEVYSANYADPSIFRKTAQKDGGFWTVSDEYLTNEIEGPPLAWLAADNNEYATRNRINEILRPSERFRHPTTNKLGGPGIFFIKKSESYPYGCYQSIKQLGAQRRKLIGYFDGKAIYSDEREESVEDHAYDCIRYFVAMHGSSRGRIAKRPPKSSFEAFRRIKFEKKKLKQFQSASIGDN